MKTRYQLARNAYQATLNREVWRERKQARAFFAQLVRRGELVFDVGASRGRVAETLEEIGCRVIAIEPNPELATFMRRHYAFEVVAAAVGDAVAEATLHVGDWEGLSTLSDEWRRVAPPDHTWGAGTVTVPVTTLDALIDQFGKPSFVKIDVEGYEPQVLAGLSLPVRGIMFEYHFAGLHLAERALDELERIGEYVFSHTVGEERRLQIPWGKRVALAEALESVRAREPRAYGDIVCRLVN
jgi:FkbM family methyltransferase